VTVADRLIIPVPPRSVDEWALSGMVDLVREAREMINPNLQGFILVNLADAQGSDNDAVKSAIRDDYLTGPEDAEEAEAWTDPNIRILDPVIINRKPFANAFGAGLSIVEYRPADRKAVDEFLDVIDAVYTPDSQRHKNVYPLNSNRAA
jgi:chromosome partitioning protein